MHFTHFFNLVILNVRSQLSLWIKCANRDVKKTSTNSLQVTGSFKTYYQALGTENRIIVQFYLLMK